MSEFEDRLVEAGVRFEECARSDELRCLSAFTNRMAGRYAGTVPLPGLGPESTQEYDVVIRRADALGARYVPGL